MGREKETFAEQMEEMAAENRRCLDREYKKQVETEAKRQAAIDEKNKSLEPGLVQAWYDDCLQACREAAQNGQKHWHSIWKWGRLEGYDCGDYVRRGVLSRIAKMVVERLCQEKGFKKEDLTVKPCEATFYSNDGLGHSSTVTVGFIISR